MNLIEIAQSFVNLAKKGFNISDQQVESLSAKRMEVCKACPHFNTSNAACKVPLFKGCCDICGCYMEAKTRNLNTKCSLETPKW